MQALLVVCRASLGQDVLACFERAQVPAFSLIESVSGTGVTGAAPTPWTPYNSLFLVVLPEERAGEVAAEMMVLSQELQRTHGSDVPLKVFGFRCEALV